MNRSVFIIFYIVISIFFLVPTKDSYGAINCLLITPTSSEADKNYCKAELAKIEAELQVLLNQQKEQQKNTGTLAGDVQYLTSQINALKTKVKARALAIAQLKVAIKEKVSTINNLSEKIDKQYASIAQLLRNTNDFDNANYVHLILSDNNLSDFYSDMESYAAIKQAVKSSVDELRGIKSETEVQKKDLESKQNAETDAKAELESAQKKTSVSEANKKQLLSISKNKEEEYKKLAAAKKATADRIRSALFSLAGTSTKIDFGTALEYANNAKASTGIDPAFLLAIITQESNLGANVGQCYLVDPITGTGKGKNTGTPFTNLMKPSRDVGPFMEITSALGFNAYSTAVSCPIAGVAGWGGAMGPAQFIPSTWKIFISRLQNALGHYPNPWSPKDAFMASSMYLTDLGGIGSSVSAQSIAACKYYGSGGASCTYSQGVMRLKAKIQADIDLLYNQ